jgi:uncharacterized RDD family membrane protein YckC
MDTLSLNLCKEGPEEPADSAEYVGFWRRAAARGIDTVLHWVVSLVVAFGIGSYFGVVERLTGRSAAAAIQPMQRVTFTALALSLLGFAIYGTIAEGLHGSTLGKQLLGVVVLRENKTPCGFIAALGRSLAYFIDSLLFGLVGAYAMSGNRMEQRYGDQWCRTVVVRKRSVPQGLLRSDLRFVGVVFLAAIADGLVVLLKVPFLAAG